MFFPLGELVFGLEPGYPFPVVPQCGTESAGPQGSMGAGGFAGSGSGPGIGPGLHPGSLGWGSGSGPGEFLQHLNGGPKPPVFQPEASEGISRLMPQHFNKLLAHQLLLD